MIEEIELTFYDCEGNNISIPLSPMQTKIVIQILGLKYRNDGYVSAYSDETLSKIFDMKGNPLRLKEV